MTTPGIQEVLPLIDGHRVGLTCEEYLEVINPSNGKPCASIPTGNDQDAALAVSSSRKAFDDGRWVDMSLNERKRVLHRLADLLEGQRALFDRRDAEEMGKPISVTAFNAASAAELIRFYAEAVDKVYGDTYPSDKYTFVTQRRVPRGVVAAIVPWNFPTYNAILKVAPAIAAGNSVVLKPSELSPGSAVHIGQLALEAGVPPGVLNVIPGRGESVGRALAMHNDVDMLAFTGSTEVGKLMLQYSGQSNMKLVQSECGGKSPHVIFADGVDLAAAAEVVAEGILTNQGQVCSAGSRLLVERRVAEQVLDAIARRFAVVTMGDASDPTTTFGPIASERQCARVMAFIDGAGKEGARLQVGGRRVRVESGGYFIEPTLLTDVRPTARVAQDEIFGPVLAVTCFDDEEEAVRLVNGTLYGLAAYVWTADLSRAMRMAKSTRSTVLINASAPMSEGPGHAVSFEPVGHSGVGIEAGLSGMEGYMRRQVIWINHA